MFSLTLALVTSVSTSGFAAQKPEPFTLTLPKSVIEMKFVPIPGDDIKIGDKTVKVKPFFMATTETPWEAFDLFLLSGPPSPPYDQTEFTPDAIARPSKSYILPDLGWGHRGYPVINVSFTTVDMYCRWLAKESGKKLRLPTEAEWELACRAGAAGPWKMNSAATEKASWNKDNSTATTHPIAKKEANAYGLFDVLGNVGEWGTDMDGEPVLCGPTFIDPASATTPGMRKRWTPKWQETDPQLPKSRWWLSDAPFAGFRMVCEG